jgi:hypothetical protein
VTVWTGTDRHPSPRTSSARQGEVASRHITQAMHTIHTGREMSRTHVQGDDTNTPPRELAQHARDEVVRVTSCQQCTSAFCRGCYQSSVSARAWGSHDPPSQSRGCGAVADSALLCPLILGGRLRHLSWMRSSPGHVFGMCFSPCASDRYGVPLRSVMRVTCTELVCSAGRHQSITIGIVVARASVASVACVSESVSSVSHEIIIALRSGSSARRSPGSGGWPQTKSATPRDRPRR